MKVHNISNIYNSICNITNMHSNNNNNIYKEVYKLLDYRWREWEHRFL
jgi:hypothetical protein